MSFSGCGHKLGVLPRGRLGEPAVATIKEKREREAFASFAFLELGRTLGLQHLTGDGEDTAETFPREPRGSDAATSYCSRLHGTSHSDPFHNKKVVGMLPLACHHFWNRGLEANQPFGYLSRRQREVSAEGQQYKCLLCERTWEYFKLSTFKSRVFMLPEVGFLSL